MPTGIDGARVSLEFEAAEGAGPDVFVGDGVGVLGGDVDVEVGEEVGCFSGPVGEVGLVSKKL